MPNLLIPESEPNQARRVTISDVSEALGLTKSTVSRALNEYPDISERTRARVRRKADEMGYRPLSQAQAIRTGLAKSIGLVIQLADHDAARPFLAEFLAGVSQGASAEGWTLSLAATNSPEETLQTIRTMTKDRKVDGFILPRSETHDGRVDLLRALKQPFVLFGRVADDTGCAWFDVLGENAMRDAVRHLVGLGHRRIGFINGGLRYNYAHLRRTGYLQGLADAAIAIDQNLIGEDAVTIAEGETVALDLLQQPDPPTAIVCAVDMAALGVYRAAAKCGLQIGSDLSVVSYDGTPDGAHASPQLTTYAVDFTKSGKRLSALLIRRIRGEAPETLRETANAVFLNRGSTGAPTKTPAQLANAVALYSSN